MRSWLQYAVLCFALPPVCAVAQAGSTASIQITGSEQQLLGTQWQTGTVTVKLNFGQTESVPYGPYSTPNSIASAIAAKISQDCSADSYTPHLAYAIAIGDTVYIAPRPQVVSFFSITISSSAGTGQGFSGVVAIIPSPTTPPAAPPPPSDPSCCYTAASS